MSIIHNLSTLSCEALSLITHFFNVRDVNSNKTTCIETEDSDKLWTLYVFQKYNYDDLNVNYTIYTYQWEKDFDNDTNIEKEFYFSKYESHEEFSSLKYITNNKTYKYIIDNSDNQDLINLYKFYEYESK